MSEEEQIAISEEKSELKAEESTRSTEKPHRSHKLRKTAFVLLVLVLISVLIAGWYGIVPGVSTILGANNARDLGVRYTAADLASYEQKTNIHFSDFASAPLNPSKPGKKTVFADPQTVDNLVISQAELTAAVNSLNWRSMPLDNVQIRAGNGTVEVSGNLKPANVSSFIHFIGGVGYSQSAIDKATSWAQKLVNRAPVYVKAEVSAVNDQLSFKLDEAKVGRLNIPQDVASNVLRTGLTNAILNADNYAIKSASFTNGQLNFSGTYPTTVYVAH